eukprot:TRINITY_DN17988_c0_g2_i1.p1 TRINITY_DN17988_c0_g2~~TRINITY_DN17988_c0_g2_i1.p1  ORF type:complete len:319 (+),score=32.33 TRINITY_DN17988_c0_g2_i1:61-1017(+)
MKTSSVVVCSVVALAAVVVALYPRKRVISWFEFITDGWLPEAHTNVAQNILSSMWLDGFERNVVQNGREVTDALSRYMNSTSCDSIVELAAGAGVAPTMWAQALRDSGHPALNIVLTDLTPNHRAWQRLQTQRGSFITYANASVDATNLAGTLRATVGKDVWERKGLRMIHLALHHFPESLVRDIVADVVNSNTAMVVADLAPTAGGLFFNPLLAAKYGVAQPIPELFSAVQRVQWWGWALMLLMPWMGVHDATVSVLRAYSVEQLERVLRTTSRGNRYTIQVFNSKSYGEWLGIPSSLHFAGLDHPVMQYVLLLPQH